MSAIEFGVLKTADDVAVSVAKRNGMNKIEFDEEIVRRVAAIVWETCVDDWCNDLVDFSTHADRDEVDMSDVALVTRRNPELFELACEMANVKIPNEKEPKTKAKNRKRKKISNNVKISPISVTPVKEKAEKLKNADIEAPSVPSFLVTPTVKPMTSTPKVTPTGNEARSKLFVKDLTPIRELVDVEKCRKMPKIVEETNEIDSFERFFGSPSPSPLEQETTLTKRNVTSLIQELENDPPPGENTVIKLMEKERLEMMAPIEEENYDSFDDNDDIIVENVFLKKNSKAEPKKARSTSPDLFSTENSRENAETSEAEGKKVASVFSNKFSAFSFEDEDSFDAPILNEKNQRKPGKIGPTDFGVKKENTRKREEESFLASTSKKMSPILIDLDDNEQVKKLQWKHSKVRKEHYQNGNK